MSDTTTTAPAGDDAIRDAVDAITEPPPPDPDRMREIAADWQRTLDDPTGLFANHPDRKAEVEAAIKTVMARHGIAEAPPVEPPAVRAARELDASFPSRGHELEPALAAAIDLELDQVEKLPREDQQRLASELRAEFGPDYARLVAEAKASDAWRPAVALSRRALGLYAGVGRYLQAYERQRGTIQTTKRS